MGKEGKRAGASTRIKERIYRRDSSRACVCVYSRNVDGEERREEVRMTEARGTETARHGAVKKSAFGGRKGMEKWRRKKKRRERDSGKEWNAVREGRKEIDREREKKRGWFGRVS